VNFRKQRLERHRISSVAEAQRYKIKESFTNRRLKDTRHRSVTGHGSGERTGKMALLMVRLGFEGRFLKGPWTSRKD
jgi:hypothetical protein